MNGIKTLVSLATLLAAVSASAQMDLPDPQAPRTPLAAKSPQSPSSGAYRAVYLGTLQELTGFLFPLNDYDDQIVYQAIQWASGKETGPYHVLLVDCLETGSWGLWPAWTSFMGRHPDVVATWTEADPVTYAFYQAGNYDVLFIGNAWHGDPNQVPPPSPGGKSWVYTDQELLDLQQYVSEGHGLIATGGSFGQFARDPISGYNNYKLAKFMCLESTGGGDPTLADALPWSRNSGGYPPIRPLTPAPITLYNDAPTHPIMAGIPASYTVSPSNAMAQWMSVVKVKRGKAVVLGHYGVGTEEYLDSLNTACQVKP